MICNSNSYSNGNSYGMASEDRVVRSLPWLQRVQVPGYPGGWPA